MVMGGILNYQTYYEETNDQRIKMNENNSNQVISMYETEDVETYFRPSKLPVLNNREYDHDFFRGYFSEDHKEASLPSSFLKSPEDVILNYFSILREAANPVKDKYAGCGTLGEAWLPYPKAYQFLSSDLKKSMTYEQFLDTFQNILHINLIKYKQIPVFDNTQNSIRYFVELETIEGTEKGIGQFAYYYGFIDIIKENDLYKIAKLEYTGENYLCAPYHGWWYDAESSVDIRYGYWCSLIKKRYPTRQDGYIKNIYFEGTDGKEYLIVFFQLTNDNDIEIAQYSKSEDGNWNLIKLNPEDCIKDKK
ncbi:MAG: hypothetical protein K0S41_737 [Anaerocolumna sp.]|jgi:hypothetical protein|nr:hypothetical protein [Anaerocolumna sp.]